MSFVVRLRVKLVDERGEFEEGRPRKIIYGLNPYRHKLIRDVRADLAVKVGVDVEQHDLEIWVDDYVVPGYTSSLVLKEDEEVLVKIVTKGLNEQAEPPDAFAEEEMLIEETPAVDAQETTNGAAAAAAKAAPVASAQPARSAAPRAAASEPAADLRAFAMPLAGLDRDRQATKLLRRYLLYSTDENGDLEKNDHGQPVFRAATVVLPNGIATYAHGSHESWHAGDATNAVYKYFMHYSEGSKSGESSDVIKAKVIYVDRRSVQNKYGSDYILLEIVNGTIPYPVCSEYPYAGQRYWCLGFGHSKLSDSLSVCHGVISTTKTDSRSHVKGDTGCDKGSSGGPVFASQTYEFLGMVVGCENTRTSVILPMAVLREAFKRFGIHEPDVGLTSEDEIE